MILGGKSLEQQIAHLPRDERCEVRKFRRFARLWPRFKNRMLQSERWRQYMAVTEAEAWLLMKSRRSSQQTKVAAP